MKSLRKIYVERDEICKKKVGLVEKLIELNNSHKTLPTNLLKKIEELSKKDENLIQESIETINFLKETIKKNNATYTRFKAKEFEKMHLSLINSMDLFKEHLKVQAEGKKKLGDAANNHKQSKVKKAKKIIKSELKKISNAKQINKLLEGTYLKNNFTSIYSFNELLSLYSNYHLSNHDLDSKKNNKTAKNLYEAIETRDYVKKHMPSLYGEDKHIALFSKARHQIHRAMILDKGVALDMRSFLVAELNMFSHYDHLI